jgi:hypothetical protein
MSNKSNLPYAGPVTVGQLRSYLLQLDRLWKGFDRSGHVPGSVPDDTNSLRVRVEGPEYDAFVKWSNTVVGRAEGPEAVEELYSRLARKLGTTFWEIGSMALADAMCQLCQPEVAPVEPIPPVLATPATNGATEAKPVVARLTLDPGTRTVTFDGRSEVISTQKAFQAFEMIVKANGAVVTSDEIRESVPGYGRAKRIDTALNRHLPEWVRKLIPGAPGHNGGFFLDLPKVERNGARRVRNGTLKR